MQPIGDGSPINTFPPPRVYARITGNNANGSHSWVQVNEGNASLANYTTANFSLSGNLTELYALEVNNQNVANGCVVRLDLAYSNQFYLFNFNAGGNASLGNSNVFFGNVSCITAGSTLANASLQTVANGTTLVGYSNITTIQFTRLMTNNATFGLTQPMALLPIGTNANDSFGNLIYLPIPSCPADDKGNGNAGYVSNGVQGFLGQKSFDQPVTIGYNSNGSVSSGNSSNVSCFAHSLRTSFNVTIQSTSGNLTSNNELYTVLTIGNGVANSTGVVGNVGVGFNPLNAPLLGGLNWTNFNGNQGGGVNILRGNAAQHSPERSSSLSNDLLFLGGSLQGGTGGVLPVVIPDQGVGIANTSSGNIIWGNTTAVNIIGRQTKSGLDMGAIWGSSTSTGMNGVGNASNATFGLLKRTGGALGAGNSGIEWGIGLTYNTGLYYNQIQQMHADLGDSDSTGAICAQFSSGGWYPIYPPRTTLDGTGYPWFLSIPSPGTTAMYLPLGGVSSQPGAPGLPIDALMSVATSTDAAATYDYTVNAGDVLSFRFRRLVAINGVPYVDPGV